VTSPRRNAPGKPAPPWSRLPVKAHAWITVVSLYATGPLCMLVYWASGAHAAFARWAHTGPFTEQAVWLVYMPWLLLLVLPGFFARLLLGTRLPARCPQCAGPAFLQIRGDDWEYTYKCRWCATVSRSGVKEGDGSG
jgi:hypothetical protein